MMMSSFLSLSLNASSGQVVLPGIEYTRLCLGMAVWLILGVV